MSHQNIPQGSIVHVQANSTLLWRVLIAVNIRKKPNLKSDSVGGLKPGTIFEELGREGDWIQHRKGWSLSFTNNVIYIAPINPPSATFWKVLDTLNVRKHADIKSTQLVTLKKGVILEELGKDNAWIKHSKGWSLSYVSSQNKFYLEPILPKPHTQLTQFITPQYIVPTQAYPQSVPVHGYPPQVYPQSVIQPPSGYPQGNMQQLPQGYPPQQLGQAPQFYPTQNYSPQQVNQGPPAYSPSAQYTAPPQYTGPPQQFPSAPPETALYPQIIGGTTKPSSFT